MKKTILTLMFFSLILLTGFSNTEVSVIKNKEKSLEEAYFDAINHISDEPIQKNSENSEITILNNNTFEAITLSSTIYKTAQILEDNKITGEKKIVMTAFQVIEKDELDKKVGLLSDQYGEKWDSSYGVKAYNRIYYNIKNVNSIPYGKLTKTTGGWTIGDSTISLSNRIVRYGTVGWPVTNPQNATKYPTGNTFSYNTPSSWEYVNLNALYNLGANTTVTLKKGNSSWTLYLENSY